MAHLFIYGTLQDKEVCEKVLGHQVSDTSFTAATLADFTVLKVAHVSYPCLVACAGALTTGYWLEGLTDTDIMVLDRFEGVNYRRVGVEIMIGKGTEQRCVSTDVYQPVTPLETDGPWCLSDWQRTGKQDFLALDFDADGIRVPPSSHPSPSS